MFCDVITCKPYNAQSDFVWARTAGVDLPESIVDVLMASVGIQRMYIGGLRGLQRTCLNDTCYWSANRKTNPSQATPAKCAIPGRILALSCYGQDTARVWHT